MPIEINFLVDSLEEKVSLSPLAWILLWCNNVDHKDNCGDNKKHHECNLWMQLDAFKHNVWWIEQIYYIFGNIYL